MQTLTPPKATAVEVVATEPMEGDRAVLAQLSAQRSKSLAHVAYVVKIRLEKIPPATSEGWALYVDDFRIPKYWEYKKGIYFKVLDPEFFAEHQGQQLRFSQNGTDFIETGLTLTAPKAATKTSQRAKTKLPRQADVLK
jgi:hypothetical protein